MSKTVVGVRAYRRHLQAMYRANPDDSHGEVYFNRGITSALSALNQAANVYCGGPCERVVPRDMGGGWCGAHHGWLGQSNRWCDLAEAPWTWAPPKRPA